MGGTCDTIVVEDDPMARVVMVTATVTGGPGKHHDTHGRPDIERDEHYHEPDDRNHDPHHPARSCEWFSAVTGPSYGPLIAAMSDNNNNDNNEDALDHHHNNNKAHDAPRHHPRDHREGPHVGWIPGVHDASPVNVLRRRYCTGRVTHGHHGTLVPRKRIHSLGAWWSSPRQTTSRINLVVLTAWIICCNQRTWAADSSPQSSISYSSRQLSSNLPVRNVVTFVHMNDHHSHVDEHELVLPVRELPLDIRQRLSVSLLASDTATVSPSSSTMVLPMADPLIVIRYGGAARTVATIHAIHDTASAAFPPTGQSNSTSNITNDEATTLITALDLPDIVDKVDESSNDHNYSNRRNQSSETNTTTTDEVVVTHDVYTLHAGDALTGSLFYTAYGPKVDATWMNAANVFDVMVLGNHEFDEGESVLADFISMLDVPIISYNLHPAPLSPLRRLTGQHTVSRYHIQELSNGDRIGTCGITVKGVTEQASSPDDGTTLDEEVFATRACVQELQERLHVNKIVVLSHVGYSFDVAKIAAIEGVDIVIGGHRHSLLGNSDTFSSLLGWTVEGEYATIVHDACVVTAYAYSKIVGQLEVEFDENGRPISCKGTPRLPFNPDMYELRDATNDAKTGQPVFLNAEDAAVVTEYLSSSRVEPFYPAHEDSAVVEALRPFREQMNTTLERPLASVTENICHHTRLFRESRRQATEHNLSGEMEDINYNLTASADPLCPNRPTQSLLGGGVCHLVAQAFLDIVHGVDIALQNAGGCAADIQAGQFTISDALKVVPHSDTLVTLVVTGKQLVQVLEEAIEFFVTQDAETDVTASSFPYGAGIRWDLDLRTEFGNRFSRVEVNPRVDFDEDVWTPINPTKSYVLVTNSYLATGNDGYRTFGELFLAKDGRDLQEDIFDTTDAHYEDWQSLIDYADDFSVLDDIPSSQYSTQSLTTVSGHTVSIRPTQDIQAQSNLVDDIRFRMGIFGTVLVSSFLFFLTIRTLRYTELDVR